MVQKLKNITFLQFMTSFHNFALEVETGRVGRVFKPILETRNVSDVCDNVWLLFLT